MADSSLGVSGSTPTLIAGSHLISVETGHVLVGPDGMRCTDIFEGDRPALELFDGRRNTQEIIVAATELDPALTPLDVLRLLRRLHGAGLLEGLDEHDAGLLFGRRQEVRRRFVHGLRRVFSQSLFIRPMGRVGVLGRYIPPSAWRIYHALALVALVGVVIWAGVAGTLGLVLTPWHPEISALENLSFIYLGAVVALSHRGLLRSLFLHSAGLGGAGGGLRIVAGVVCFDVDDRERSLATRETRFHLALLGATTFAFLGALCGALSLAGAQPFPQIIASMSVILLVLDITPYLRADGRHLVGILAGIPHLRTRSWSFLMRRAGANMRSSGPTSSVERRYIMISTWWISHALILTALLVGFVLPDVLAGLVDVITGHASTDAMAPTHPLVLLGFYTASLLVLSFAAAVLFLLLAALFVIWQLMAPPARAANPRAQAVSQPIRERFKTDAAGIPFFAKLDPDALETLSQEMAEQDYTGRQILVKQGTSSDRFFYLAQGQCAVDVEEESGLTHRVATLRPGDFFGEAALVEASPRQATVRALGDVKVLTLKAEGFREVVRALGSAADSAQRQLRYAILLRDLDMLSPISPGELRTLLDAAQERQLATGEYAIRQGEQDRSVFIIMDGSFAVERREEDGSIRPIATLGRGDCFGEIAFLTGAARTADVRATSDASLLHLPVDVLNKAMLDDFDSWLSLERGAAARLEALLET